MTTDFLILGAGWSSTFLIPLISSRGLSYKATSRSGNGNTIPFTFDPASSDLAPFAALPSARSVLITFPIALPGGSSRLIDLYDQTHPQHQANFIQLGTTSIWDGTPDPSAPARVQHAWYDRHSPLNPTHPRAAAEVEFLAHSPTRTAVLNLSGLWGGARDPRNWVRRVAPSKDSLREKGSLHMIHGHDVARAILAVHVKFALAAGQRWLLSDGRVYDWWDLASAWGTTRPSDSDATSGEDTEEARWVRELMHETGVRGLPRNTNLLGRALDSREFWETFGLAPERARLELDRSLL